MVRNVVCTASISAAYLLATVVVVDGLVNRTREDYKVDK